MKADLPNYFIEVSRIAIFNYQHINHFELLDNGLINVVLTNNHSVQISRRNIKNLKKRLKILKILKNSLTIHLGFQQKETHMD